MARRTKSRKNLFGFGKKITVHRAGGASRRDISSLAFKAGQRSGDSGLFASWADSKNLKTKWDRDALKQFERSYRDGVEKGEAIEAKQEEKKEAKKEAKQEKRDAKVQAKKELEEVQTDVIEALAGLGMSRSQAKALARSKYRSGDSFGDLFDRIMKRTPAGINPAKFDRCVKDVSKSMKKSHRKGSPYAICTAAGTRNPKRSNNPLEKARKLREDFTGLPAGEILKYQQKDHFHEYVTGAGKLVCLDVLTVDGREIPIIAPGFSFDPKKYLRRDLRHSHEGTWILDPSTPASKLVQVSFSEDGKQLIFTGGDQSIPLEAMGFGPRDMRDNMFIGTVVEITYRTKKKFEANGKEEVDFHHEFGKQGSRGVLPLLGYYLRVQRMFSLGGRYEIAPVRADIGASPGIVG
jgi:hypothetical protein